MPSTKPAGASVCSLRSSSLLDTAVVCSMPCFLVNRPLQKQRETQCMLLRHRGSFITACTSKLAVRHTGSC